MKHSICRFAAIAAMVSLLLIGPAAPVAALESVTLQMATISPPDNLWSRAGARYAEKVKERTGGKVTIQIAYSGSTGNARQTIEALQFGTNHIVIQEPQQLGGYGELAGISAYPYLIRDIKHFRKFADGPIGTEFSKAVEAETGFKIIGSGYRGARETASRKPIKTVGDLKGLKIRVPESKIYRRTWEVLGASPVPMPSMEVYTALQQGIIDACENPLEAHVRSKYYEAVPYIVLTEHVKPWYTFIFWGKYFKSLAPELQNILIEEGNAAMSWGTDQTLKMIGGYTESLKNKGAKFITPNVEEFRITVAPMKADFPKLAPWVDRIMAIK